MKRIALLTAAFGGLSACSTTSLPPPQVIDSQYIGTVQTEIKRQVGVYSARAAAEYAKEKRLRETRPTPLCGDGEIDYDISSITVDLLTTIDNTAKAGGSATIPVATAVTVGPSVSGSHEVTNTQELIYNQWPEPTRSPPDLSAMLSDPKPAPIADVLIALRAAMVNNLRKGSGAAQQLCFIDFNPAKPQDDPGNTYKLALQVVNDATGGVNVGLGIVSLTASDDNKHTLGNTITIHFKQSNIPANATLATPCNDKPGMISFDGGKTCTPLGVEGLVRRQFTGIPLM